MQNAKTAHKRKKYKILKETFVLENMYKILKYDFEPILNNF